jgi:hypothetical protein
MTYRHPSTDDERHAAALLRDKGWNVREPQCPDCHGFGLVGDAIWYSTGDTENVTHSTERCPRGCAVPTMIL